MQLYQYSDLSGQFSLEYCHGLSMFGALSDESLSFLLTHGDIYNNTIWRTAAVRPHFNGFKEI